MKLLSILAIATMFASCNTKVIFTTSEKDANIYVDGRSMGNGETPVVKVYKDRDAKVKIAKAGFLTEEFDYVYTKNNFKPEVKFVELKPDMRYNSSMQTDYANNDFEQTVKDGMDEDEAWKVLSQVVLNYFDNLEMADKATGYMRTSWQYKKFDNGAVRTRIIVKQSGIKPLKYKLKIISEHSSSADASVKNDNDFKEWDRILRTYSELINEYQSRLGENS
jgi:hypothetical protein